MPHNMERKDQRALWGTALMGSGNRTYGEQLRGEGNGSFLSLDEAMRLASHPIFCGSVKGFGGKANAKLEDIKLEPKGKSFTFSARVVAADPPVYGIIGYTDPEGGGDYDATTYTAVPDKDGRFTLDCNDLALGKAGSLRIVMLQANGAKNSDATPSAQLNFPYFVNRDGSVDLTAVLARQQLSALVKAVIEGRDAAAQAEISHLESEKAEPRLLEVARVLSATTHAKPGPCPAQAEGDHCALSDAATKEARVGFGTPVANRLPEGDPLLMAGNRLFARGLYAHAPAHHVWELGGKWSRLTGTAGVAQGHAGSVVFSVTADGRELWHSKLLKEGETATYDVPLKDAQQLELNVSDGGDGNSSDWGLWLEPTLTR
jgi:hypothetical protein